ncbi:ROK family transcriptional regulator [Cellulomonas endophytica]|uniref:ROK family transcriptional regulator n=1 Tax=Cellulomonas endophytica TaxID=2494735 RepID=UPI001012A203|nr:ROK family transcriptional regulator [Cellulomonas endophytica]
MVADAPLEPWAWRPLGAARRAVLLDVLVHGPRSRAELTRRTGLSRTTLSRLTRDLTADGLLADSGPAAATGPGRPSDVVALVPDAAHLVGMKLTGDALYVAVTDLAAQVRSTAEVPLASRAFDDVVAEMAAAVARVRAAVPRVAAVGVCLAGDVRLVDGLAWVTGSDFLGWDRVPLEAALVAATGLPTAVSNDVQCLTVAHHWFGAGVGAATFAVVAVGEGIGAGLVVDGDLVRGAHGRPGKVSHVPVDADGPPCDRGHPGCASGVVTVPAVLRATGAASFPAVLEAAAAGDARCDAALRAAARALGAVVAQLVNLTDPEKVVVTGEAREVATYARAQLDASLRRRLDPSVEAPPVEVHPFAFTDYAWGAAISAIRHLL